MHQYLGMFLGAGVEWGCSEWCRRPLCWERGGWKKKEARAALSQHGAGLKLGLLQVWVTHSLVPCGPRLWVFFLEYWFRLMTEMKTLL